MALTMTERPGAVSTRSAAALAASVAPETAIPMSACLSAGASLTPSPVMPVMWPLDCMAFTISNLCSGKTCAKPSEATILSVLMVVYAPAVSSFLKNSSAGCMFVPRPSCADISLAIAVLSPVTIFTFMPCSLARLMVSAESSRGGSKSGNMPRNFHLPSSRLATPRVLYPLAAKDRTASPAFFLSASSGSHRAIMACGAPLVTPNLFPSGEVTSASVRFDTGSNGVNLVCLYLSNPALSLSPPSTARSIGSWSSALDARAPASTTSSTEALSIPTGSPRRSLFCVSVPVLSEQRISIPAISSIDSRRETMAFILERATAPIAMVIESTAGMATGIDATARISANWTILIKSAPLKSWTITISVIRPTLMQMR